MSAAPLSALILAAGRSSRMGRPKALLPLGTRTVIEHVADTLRRSGVDDVRAVVGHGCEALAPVLEKAGVRRVVNPHWEAGMFSSVQAGLGSLAREAAGCLILPVDVPLVRPWTLRHLAARFRARPELALVPTFGGAPGHPPFLPAALAPAVAAFPAQGGLRAFLAARPEGLQEVPVADRHVLFDVDRPEDYRELERRWRTWDIPEPEECEAILTVIHPAAEALRRHGRAVARAAAALGAALVAAGQALDLEALGAAARLHDVAKGRPAHAATGAAWLREMGYGRVAALVAAHQDLDPAPDGGMGGAEALYLADKCVLGTRLVDPEARFQAARERFAADPEALAAVARRQATARDLRRRLEGLTGRSLAGILEAAGSPLGGSP
jgi:CTP:molybdopterin cytidylyltransferase MocA